MTDDVYQRILAEAEPDFAATLAPGATLADLSRPALARFGAMWLARSGVALVADDRDALVGCGLLDSTGRVTNAALIVLRTPGALREYLAAAEVKFSYRLDGALRAAQTIEFCACRAAAWPDRSAGCRRRQR